MNQHRVSLRPAPDGMCRLSAVLPLPDGVGAYTTLAAAADTARAAGDDRARGAVMADEPVTRITGRQQPADVTIDLVKPDATLLGSDDPDARHDPDRPHLPLAPTTTARSTTADADRLVHARAVDARAGRQLSRCSGIR